ncbi:pre-toxin TG domain-containing protein [Leptotrichia massiliensis]|uniref:pre-toxin TG domain-containing protein n=1 Tax=Leptotrichia massiliensis TaxID=1852388 RepID=UPI0028D7E357|nr:pre-toxin TG domain-containing protein [Leptotrichia massiliensis]
MNVPANRSNQNTVENVYANGNFKNVNEVHNNTGSMVLNGFNQEGGKVTGNIGKVEVISRQNTSTTTGSSRGMSIGISANGVPSSVNINGSRTNGDRAFVDNQSTFIVGEGSSLHVGTLENTGAVVGKQGNSTFKIDSYIGKDIQNHDTMKTTGGSLGISTGKPRITNVGFNQDSRDKQGITRNTVVGDVEIGETSGSPINRDITRANEVTKDTHSSTNINVESQTIEYATNPAKLKEDIGKAKDEINDIKWAIDKSIHDMGHDNRNFFGQLSEVRLNKTIDNITSQRLIGKTVDTEIAGIFKDAYKDLGYDIEIIFSDPKNSPQLLDENDKPKTGTAYVRDENGKKIKTIIINGKDPKNATKAGLIGTIVEEGSHVIGKVEGRQRKTGTDEKGLESTGRASNEYFAEKYKDDNTPISIHSDGKDYSNVDFGENVGDTGGACSGGLLKECLERNRRFMDSYNKVDRNQALRITSFIIDFSPAGTVKGGIEAITGKDILTGEEINLLSRVLGAIPFVKPVFKGTKKLIQIFKIAGKKQVVLADGTEIMLNLDEVTKFEKQAKEAKIKNKGNSSKPSTEMIVRRGHFNGEYKPSPKHKGPKMPPNASPDSIPDIKTGNDLLKNHSYNSATKKQRFAIYKGKMIKFQPTGTSNEWHAYELTDKQIKSQQVPPDVLKQMLKDGVITKPQYNKWH